MSMKPFLFLLLAGTAVYCQNMPTSDVGSGPNLMYPAGLEFYNGNLYASDYATGAVYKIDLTNGNRVHVTSNQMDSDVLMAHVSDLTFVGSKLYVVDQAAVAVIEVDTTSGKKTIISGPNRGTGGTEDHKFRRPFALDSDEDGHLHVADWYLGLVRVDVSTGRRYTDSTEVKDFGMSSLKIFDEHVYGGSINDGVVRSISLKSNHQVQILGKASGQPDIENVWGVAIDETRKFLYVVDTGEKQVVRINIGANDWTRQIISGSNRGSGPEFINPSGVAIGTQSSILYVADYGAKAIFSVNTNTGNREVISYKRQNAGFSSPTGLTCLPKTHCIALADQAQKIWVVDPASGSKYYLSDHDIKGSGKDFGMPFGITAHADENFLIVADVMEGGIKVDISTGARSAFYASDSFGNDDKLIGPRGVIKGGQSQNQIPLFYFSVFEDSAIYSADTNGLRRVTSKSGSKGLGAPFRSPLGLDTDPDYKTLYVADFSSSAVYSVNIGDTNRGDGQRELISGPSVSEDHPLRGSGTPFKAITKVLYVDQNTLFVSDAGLPGIFEVNIQSGRRTVLSAAGTGGRGSGPGFTGPVDMTFGCKSGGTDSSSSGSYGEFFKNSLYVTDMGSGNIFLVEVNSGNRAVISGTNRGRVRGNYNGEVCSADTSRLSFVAAIKPEFVLMNFILVVAGIFSH